MRTTVTVYRAHNYLRITDYSPEFVNRVIHPFTRRFLLKYKKEPIPGTRKSRTVVDKVFARQNNDKSELRISAGLFREFTNFVEQCGYHQKRINIVEEPTIVPKRCSFEWNPGYGNYKEDRKEEQKEWCDYQLEPGAIKVNNGRTGMGKSWCATHLMVNMGVRTIITALPRYVSIWTKCLPEYLNVSVQDIVVMERGLISELADNIEQGVIDPKIIIIPLTRYDTYLKQARDSEEMEPLDSCFNRMGIGLRIMDEGHESAYQVYMSMLFGNFEKTLALSATLKADDEATNRIYSYIYPMEIRFKDPVQSKYIDVYAYHHRIDVQKYRIKSQGFGGYSHVAFEQSLMKSPRLMQEYYKLIRQSFIEFYITGLRDKQRCLFFFATVEMCSKILDLLKKDYPDFDIVKYTNAESSDKELKNSYMEHQVVITTSQSCGTGKDIPYLYVVISPYAVSSRQRNAQMLGRLRTIEKWWPDLNPKYVYFVCRDIPKQVDYHKKRTEEFADKSKSMTNIDSFHRIA